MSTPPHRRFEVVLRIGADEWNGVLREVDWIRREIEEHGPTCTSVSGGPDSNHIVEIAERPEMTHDRYFEELETHLAAVRLSAPASDSTG
jgi:hypothetical protein